VTPGHPSHLPCLLADGTPDLARLAKAIEANHRGTASSAGRTRHSEPT